MKLVYLEESGIEDNDYRDFLKRCYEDRGTQKWLRYKWYLKWPDYRVLLAVDGGKILGQSCSFCVMVLIGGERKELWWSIDTFVLKEYRGRGIGKMLQGKLFSDLPNFTSASYSRGNGVIKRKNGAVPLFFNEYHYYAVSCYFYLLLSLAQSKLFNKEIFKPRHSHHLKYLRLKKIKGLEMVETSLDTTLSTYINNLLAEQFDWYVERSPEYLKWKYGDNPSIKVYCKYIYKNGQRVGFISYSGAGIFRVANKEIRGIKIFDLLIEKKSGVSSKDVISAIVKESGGVLDGILSNIPLHFLWGFTYHSLPLLSPDPAIVKHPYITLMDQDMEQ